jgi:5,5'-dehydrodivanillate O-demethylase
MHTSDFERTGPGTLAGRYLRRFWQPVYESKQLPAGRAVPIRVLGEDFTLYRGETGVVHLMAHRCAHRGTQLSTGWVESDCLRCFYHGWKYDGSGLCVEQPAEDETFTRKVRIASWPVHEYLGAIFAYLGEGQAPPFRPIPGFGQEGVIEVLSYVRNCNYFQNLENNLDISHVSFVHTHSFQRRGVGRSSVPAELISEETHYGLCVHARQPGETRCRTVATLMPNMLNLKQELKFGARQHIGWRVPIDDSRHTQFHIVHVGVTGEQAERYLERFQQRPEDVSDIGHKLGEAILRGELTIDQVAEHAALMYSDDDLVNVEDVVAQVGQGTIVNRQAEHLGKEDVGVILLRKVWARELQALADGRPLTEWVMPDPLPAGSHDA